MPGYQEPPIEAVLLAEHLLENQDFLKELHYATDKAVKGKDMSVEIKVKPKVTPAVIPKASLMPKEKTPVKTTDLSEAIEILSEKIFTKDTGTALPVETKQGAGVTTIKSPDGSIEEVQHLVGKPQVFTGPTCEVGVESGFTLNLGNYQSARFGVTVKIPCAHTEMDGVFTFAEAWVNEKMEQMVAKAKASMDQDKKF